MATFRRTPRALCYPVTSHVSRFYLNGIVRIKVHAVNFLNNSWMIKYNFSRSVVSRCDRRAAGPSRVGRLDRLAGTGPEEPRS